MADHASQVQYLDRNSCLELLQTAGIGRVAWAREDGHVVVIPVNFVMDRETVVFKTAEGDKLDAVRQGRAISFQADDVEPALRLGWSVLVTGPADVVTDAEQLRQLAALPLAPWDPGPKAFFVRLHARDVSGRRLPLHPGTVTVVRLEG